MFRYSRRQYSHICKASGLAVRNQTTFAYHTFPRPSAAVLTKPRHPLQWRNLAAAFSRHNSTTQAESASEATAAAEARRANEPAYEITFTCRPCQGRSAHRISKQGYHKGSVLITCPDCKARHIISDHLNMFGDAQTDIEKILKEKGEMVKRGTLGEEGDVEFWEDGSNTPRKILPEELVKEKSLE